jgi:hypothetical protein
VTRIDEVLFLRSVLRLLVSAKGVPSSPIPVVLTNCVALKPVSANKADQEELLLMGCFAVWLL